MKVRMIFVRFAQINHVKESESRLKSGKRGSQIPTTISKKE